MRSVVHGSTLPVLEVHLDRGQCVVSEAGELSWKTPSVDMQTGTGGAGFLGAMGRVLSGGTLFMTTYRATSAPGLVAFAAKIPGSITEIDLAPGQGYLVHRHGFLCGTEEVQLQIGFQQRLSAGVFGGDGLVLQKVPGSGRFWVELGGEAIVKDLAHGETIQVHPGHVGMFADSVTFGLTRIAGARNLFFGGDGIFLAQLTGPGRVWLQTLTLPNLAHALAPYLAQSR